ncbi:Phospholipase/Carboxylesterase-domain-containing protein [Calycina marina]|uniref:Phospholipase/Carboxylesterase-domain-containing protein n=1 Tax=Calycina marina TaxID=1763456 RepID=A0A9P8CFP2_9HELO|nr:Phospholipase/Carboxylesterase-domain-containing protein [Calycina marina]
MSVQPLQASDLPGLTLDVVPSPKGSNVNVLILLHGLGDSHESFTKFGRNINLAETTCISVRGFTPVPAVILGSDAPSFHWTSDIAVDERTGDIDIDGDFSASISRLSTLIIDPLMSKLKVPARNIFFFGFGQGGMLALSLLSVHAYSVIEFGGVISIGAAAPSSNITTTAKKRATPILVCGGKKSKVVTNSALQSLKQKFKDVEYEGWAKPGDGMPASRGEIIPIFKFLGRRLRSRAGVVEGAVEI